jgi:hypothetical protein
MLDVQFFIKNVPGTHGPVDMTAITDFRVDGTAHLGLSTIDCYVNGSPSLCFNLSCTYI